VQTTLLGFAIGLILALLAALVGPHFVDWNNHRAFFEAEASRLIGDIRRLARQLEQLRNRLRHRHPVTGLPTREPFLTQLVEEVRHGTHTSVLGVVRFTDHERLAAFEQAAADRLLGVFAAVALLLAAVGIYSVLSYIVRGRSREIGIRTALGAQTGDVLRLVIVEGMWPVLAGIAVGTLAALASARVMKTLVFGVSASDPLTLAAVAATLAVVALIAGVVPAYRALRLDPLRVLRTE
jgi:predicted lysophospholipase L1 biosynthesis ABC-type transport system permease subunit